LYDLLYRTLAESESEGYFSHPTNYDVWYEIK